MNSYNKKVIFLTPFKLNYKDVKNLNNFGKNIALRIIVGLLLVALFNLFQQPGDKSGQVGIPFSDFLAEVNNGQVRQVTIKGNNISGLYADGRGFTTFAPNDPNLVEKLTKHGVVIKAMPTDDSSPSLIQILISWFPTHLNNPNKFYKIFPPSLVQIRLIGIEL